MQTTIFEVLKYSGENFFENKYVLDQVRERTKQLCDEAKREFGNIQGQFDNSDQSSKPRLASFKELLLSSLNIENAAPVKYEQRNVCTPEEEELIREACLNKNKTADDIEKIKHALGFTSTYKQDQEFKKPCVAIVGQTKAGKSSLINSLLGDRVVPQKGMKQTARVTYITYCDIKFVAHLKNSRLLKICVDEGVRESDVDLAFEDRRKFDQVSVEIRAGVCNLILRNGFDIVDSPGLNENPALNDLCKKMEESLLPLLIYVIDGKNCVTESDVLDIKNIREHTPELKMLYFVTKLDRSVIDRAMYDRKKAKKGLSKDQDLEGESDVEVAKRRLNNVFKKLQKNAFLSLSSKFDNCSDFNGANLAYIQSLRISNNEFDNGKEINKYNFQIFDKFERNLLDHLKCMVELPLKADIQSLQTTLEKMLEHTTSCASDIMEAKQEKRDCLKRFQENEEDLFEKQSKAIEQNLANKLRTMLDQYIEKVKQVIREDHSAMKSRKSNSQSMTSSFGMRSDYDMKSYIEKSLKTEMEEFMTKFMLECDETLILELKTLVSGLSTGEFGRNSFEEMLKNRLLHAYELTEECQFTQSIGYAYESVKRTRTGRILATLRDLFRNFGIRTPNREIMESSETSSSEMEADSIISQLDKEKFIDNISTKVLKEFKENHETFTKQMSEEKTFLETKFEVGETDKARLKEFAEKLAYEFAQTLLVQTDIRLVFDPTRPSEPVGPAQARIEKVFLKDQNDPILKKIDNIEKNEFERSDEAKKWSLRIYYTSRLKDTRLLSLLGIKKESKETAFHFSSFYPYLPSGSLKNFLDCHELSLKKRLKLAIDIAGGLQLLHSLKIIHRDITLHNILVRNNSQDTLCSAVIGDFCFLNSLGFANREFVGSSIYKPEEIYNEPDLRQHGYTYASDVYSFGITLWQLLSYRLTDDYNNFDPQFVIDSENDAERIKTKIRNGARPERRDLIPDDLNVLLDNCWHKDRDKRLSFVKPNALLSCSMSSTMRGKIIGDVLSEVYQSLGE